MAKLVSKTYGDALFDLALEENKVDELYEEIVAVKQILLDNADFTKLMNHPKVVKEEKESVMESVFKGRVSDEITGFLKIIITNNRFSDVFAVMDYFIAKVKEYKKIGVAFVATPMELTDAQKNDVMKKLLETTKYESMEINYDIDESLIGGMVIRIGDRVVDSSIKTKLDKMKRELSKIQLANG